MLGLRRILISRRIMLVQHSSLSQHRVTSFSHGWQCWLFANLKTRLDFHTIATEVDILRFAACFIDSQICKASSNWMNTSAALGYHYIRRFAVARALHFTNPYTTKKAAVLDSME